MPARSHGGTGTRLYVIWRNMKARCTKSYAAKYKNYGGRGISICNEWLNDFETFRNWSLSNGYSDDLTLDRIDNNGNYEPNNCRWVSNSEQQHNKRTNRMITFHGETKTLTQWAREKGLSVKSLETRLGRCRWDLEKALTTPMKTSEIKDLSGQRFGRWQVIKLSDTPHASRSAYWECLCDCGTVKDVKSDSLVSGHSRSCGCLNREQASARLMKRWHPDLL